MAAKPDTAVAVSLVVIVELVVHALAAGKFLSVSLMMVQFWICFFFKLYESVMCVV